MFLPYLQLYRGCVPQAVFDSWRHYQWIGSPLDIPSWARMQAFTTPGYSLHDLKTLKAELDNFAAAGKAFDEIAAFFDAKREANTAHMAPLKAVENWVKETEKSRLEENKAVKAQRAEFYAERAARMHPPVGRGELETLTCFKKAVAILRPANERSWLLLLPKIEEERKAMMLKIQEVLEGGMAGDMGPKLNFGRNGPGGIDVGRSDGERVFGGRIDGGRVVGGRGMQSGRPGNGRMVDEVMNGAGH